MNRNSMAMTDELLVKCLLGEASAEEQEQLRQWTEAGEENKRYYEQFRSIWDKSRVLAAESKVDEQAAWQRFQQRVQDNEARQTRTIPLGKPGLSWVRVAAILIVLLGGGVMAWYFGTQRAGEMLAVNSEDRVLIDTLPDGSVVTLNKHSSISYPTAFDGDTRPVKLQGEAFFNVTPNKSKPFIIDANGTSIRVVGTSFNVKSNRDSTEVLVETGVVEVSKKKNAVKLNPHQKATVHKGSDEPVKADTDDELYNYYKTKEFICNRTPLWRLVDVLNEAYSVHIVIANNAAANMQLTTTFRDRSLDEVLTVVAETLGLRIERKGNEIIIK